MLIDTTRLMYSIVSTNFTSGWILLSQLSSVDFWLKVSSSESALLILFIMWLVYFLFGFLVLLTISPIIAHNANMKREPTIPENDVPAADSESLNA